MTGGGRELTGSAFPDDDGRADPRVSSALAAYDRGDGGVADVVTALAGSRVLVPVVAVLDELETAAEAEGASGAGGDGESGGPTGAAGLPREKSSHMAAVSTTSRSGRRGLLAFTSVEAMQRWDPAARPVPVATRAAAEAALADGADALVVDLAGPVTFAVDAPDLRSLAAGWREHSDWRAHSPDAGRSGRGGGFRGLVRSAFSRRRGR